MAKKSTAYANKPADKVSLPPAAGEDIPLNFIEDFEARIYLAVEEMAQAEPSGTVGKEAPGTGSLDVLPSTTESRSPANDDQKSAAFPVRKSFLQWRRILLYGASLFTGWFFLFQLLLPEGFRSLTQSPMETFTEARTILLIALAIGLPFLLRFFRMLGQRVEEVNRATQVMLDTAVKFRDRKNDPQDQTIEIQNQIRKEMNDLDQFMKQSLERTCEFGRLIRQEMKQLENSGTQNEAQMLEVIENLKKEREELIHHASNVRSAISSGQNSLKEDMERATIFLKGEFERHLEDIENVFLLRGQSFISEFELRTEAIETARENVSKSIDTTLQQGIHDIDKALKEHMTQAMGFFNATKDDFSHSFEICQRRMNQEVETSVNSVSNSFTAYLENFILDLEKKRNAAVRLLEEDLNRLSETYSTLGSSSSQEIQFLLEQKKQISETLGQRIEELACERASFENSVRIHIEQTKQITAVGLRSDLEQLNKARAEITETARLYTAECLHSQKKLSESLENDLQKISQSKTDFTSFITDLVETECQKLEKGKDSLEKVIEGDLEKIVHVRSQIEKATQNQIKEISENTQALSKAISDDLGKIDTSKKEIEQCLLENVKVLSESRAEISRIIETDIEKIEESLRHHDALVSEKTGSIEKTFLNGVERLTSAFNKGEEIAVESLKSKISRMTEKLADETQAMVCAISQKIEDSAGKAENMLSHSTEQIIQNFNTMNETLSRNVVQSVELAEKNVETTQEVIESKIEKACQDLHSTQKRVALESSGVIEDFIIRTSDSGNLIHQNATRILQALEGAEESFGRLTKETVDGLDFKARKIVEIFDSKDKQLSERIVENVKALGIQAVEITGCFDKADRKLAQRVEESAAILNSRLEESGQKIEGLGKAIADQIQNSSHYLKDEAVQILSSLQKTDEKMKESVKDLSESIEEKTTLVTSALEHATGRLVQYSDEATLQLEKQGYGICELLAGAEKRLIDSAITASSRIIEHFSDSHKRLLIESEETEQRIKEQIDSSSLEIDEKARLINAAFDSVNTNIHHTAQHVGSVIEEKTRSLTEALRISSHEMCEVLDKNAAPLIERFVLEGKEFQSSIAHVTEEACRNLSHENKGLIEEIEKKAVHALARAGDIREVLEDTFEGLIQKLDVSGSSLTNVLQKAREELDNADHNLKGTAQIVFESAQQSMKIFEDSSCLVNQKAYQLDNTTSQAFQKIAAITNRFDAYGKLLSDSCEILTTVQNNLSSNMQDRQGNLESLLVGLIKKSEDIENTIQSFEKVISSTLERAGEQTRSSSENMTATLEEVMDLATKRFEDATFSMQKSAIKVRAELEETIVLLKNGITDMPQEVHKTTSTIRDAITEQVNALKELASAAVQYKCPQDAVTESHPNPPACVSQERVKSAREVENAPVDNNTGLFSSFPSGRKEEESKETLIKEPLSLLDSDIALAIDLEALNAFWRNLESGKLELSYEQMIDSLYTPKGKELLAEIRLRCRYDTEFHKTIERYCSDFEKLVNGIPGTESGKAMLKAYRMSSKGKGYIILAHASGRL